MTDSFKRKTQQLTLIPPRINILTFFLFIIIIIIFIPSVLYCVCSPLQLPLLSRFKFKLKLKTTKKKVSVNKRNILPISIWKNVSTHSFDQLNETAGWWLSKSCFNFTYRVHRIALILGSSFLKDDTLLPTIGYYTTSLLDSRGVYLYLQPKSVMIFISAPLTLFKPNSDADGCGHLTRLYLFFLRGRFPCVWRSL